MIWNIIVWLIFGALAGWAASKLMKSEQGLVTNIVLGIVGSLVGGLLARIIGIKTDGFSIGALLIAIGGACLLIWGLRKVKK
ncbi:MAG: GlsB/YeaQ/YmgE family stress response membrane protein [Clostridiales bacterium]|nr:GlsB/YeaQ/YmgE family stress response membrane protein [Clostridiales bacterium]